MIFHGYFAIPSRTMNMTDDGRERPRMNKFTLWHIKKNLSEEKLVKFMRKLSFWLSWCFSVACYVWSASSYFIFSACNHLTYALSTQCLFHHEFSEIFFHRTPLWIVHISQRLFHPISQYRLHPSGNQLAFVWHRFSPDQIPTCLPCCFSLWVLCSIKVLSLVSSIPFF